VPDLGGRLAGLSGAQRALLELRLAQRRGRQEPVAIVGMACRFPGAAGLDAYWRLLHQGLDAISEVPRERWDADALFDPDPQAAGRMSTRWGGFLRGVDRFDADFFAISPREAARMDPQQRLLLEVAWEALEDAGQAPRDLAGSATGVFVGIFMDDYRRLALRDRERPDAYTGTGSTFCIAANRISYQLDLRGPSLAVDTACSSSLVAVHLACRSLATGESTLALAGGVNLLLTPEPTIEMSKAGLMAPDGRCKTFDARADGYVRGEGAGMVVLKPLALALADGDLVHAVIRGTAVNQDGRTNGLTSPNRFAQEAVLRAAYRQAGVAPARVQYVEAHGTGTALGDAIECRALGTVCGAGRPASRPLAVGSVKSNFGHLEAAAGVAGLIKVALALAHGEVPASLHCPQPHPDIPFAELSLAVQRHRAPWPRQDGAPALGGVSSFGFGGTNAHVVLEAAPAPAAAPPAAADGGERPLHLLALSARTAPAMRQLAQRHLRRLAGADGDPLADLCFSANAGRAAFEHRLAAWGESREAMAAQLAAFLGEPRPAAADGWAAGARTAAERPKIGFLFSGQGAQRPGMARELFRTHPGCRQTLLRCQEILAPHLERPLLAVMFGEPGTEGLLDETLYTQPALFALEVALAELWRTWGIVPDALLGHSAGELAAACAAGVFSLEDGLALVARRARLMAALPRDGAMAALAAPAEEVAAAVAPHGREVAIAALNGPADTVISGRREAVEAIAAGFRARGIEARSLEVSHAFHSPLVDPILGELAAAADLIHPLPPRPALISGLTGAPFGDGETPDAAYWARHARQPTRFAAGMETLRRLGCELFVEIGPGATLLGMGARLWGDAPARWLPSLRQGEGDWQRLLRTLGTLFTAGVDPDWRGFDAGYRRTRRRLPSYPFQRRRFWLEARDAEAAALAAAPGPRLVRAAALPGDPPLAARLERLAGEHALGAGSISQVTGKTHLFVSSRRDAYLHLAQAGSSLVGMDYTGPEAAYEPLLRELLAFAAERGLAATLVEETPERLGLLDRLGFSATRVGVWQDLEELAAFDLAGGAMRRLRYLIQRYQAQGGCEVVEAEPGTDAALDGEIQAVMAAWAASRRVTPAFLAHLERLAFVDGGRHRVFLVRRGERLDGVIFLLPSPALARRCGAGGERQGGQAYLMDIECYRPDAPAGCLEFGIAEIIRTLRAEGAAVLSLGLTLGSQLGEHPGDDPEARALFAKLHQEGLLNGDANLQFKNKFRPRTVPAFLCRLRGADPERLLDVIRLLADPFGGDAAEGPGRLDAATVGAAPGGAPDAGAAVAARAAAGPIGATGLAGPLGLRRLDLAVPGRVFACALDLGERPLLGDHRIDGAAVLPAAALAAMALAASRLPLARAEIAELVIRWPLVLPEQGTRRVQVVAGEGAAAGTESVEIFARGEDKDDEGAAARAAAWRLLATATIREAAGEPPENADLAALTGRCPLAMSGQELYAELAAAGHRYGPRFRAVERLWLGDGEVLGRLVFPAGDSTGADGANGADGADSAHGADGTHGADGAHGTDGAHDADGAIPLLDAAFHLTWPLVRAFAGGRSLAPVSVAGLRLRRPLEGSCWVHGRRLSGSGEGGCRLALRLLDEAGEELGACAMLTLARAAGGRQPAAALPADQAAAGLYEIAWRPAAGEGTGAADAHWILLADDGGVAAALAARLAGRGARSWLVRRGGRTGQVAPEVWEVEATSPQGWTRLLAATGADLPLRIVHGWALDLPAGIPADPRSPAWLVGSLPALVQGVAAAGREGACRIWLVTAGAQAVGAGSGDREAPLAVAQAPLWGAGRVLAREHPELWGGLVDLAPGEVEALAAALCSEVDPASGGGNVAAETAAAETVAAEAVPAEAMAAETVPAEAVPAEAMAPETVAAVAGGVRHVARLTRRPQRPPAGTARVWEPDTSGTYLVTGGLGALGLLVAERLAERGVRHLALLGRHAPPAAGDVAGRIDALRRAGAEVRVLLADVAERAALAAALADLAAAQPPLRGVVHAAGVVDDGVLLGQSWERCARVLAPKVAGALNLHELTRGLDLRHFILFSSASALLGTPGQASYAAANALLAALAHERRRQGLPACCLHWGPWAGSGLASAMGERERRLAAAWGLGMLAPRSALDALDEALAADLAEVTVLALDARRLAASAMGREPLFAELVAGLTPDTTPDLAPDMTPDMTPDLAPDVMPAPAAAARRGRAGPGHAAGAAASAVAGAVAGGPRRGLPRAAARNRADLGERLRGLVAAALHRDPAEVGVDVKLNRLGMDSLTAMELRNRLRAELAVELPVVALFDYPTVRQLTALVQAGLDGPPATALPAAPMAARPPAPRVDVELLSDDEVGDMLERMLREEGA
jgi:acyl transferase domain-containing protein/nucleoside-diphosphate-sugar epimerase/acyl carrier protein